MSADNKNAIYKNRANATYIYTHKSIELPDSISRYEMGITRSTIYKNRANITHIYTQKH